ncbi:MAG: nicotinamide mononucleotide transporter [Bacteroidales bacterium]|nr:nicotinamide mononucleotide transporter [Bacteroidales bacterium]
MIHLWLEENIIEILGAIAGLVYLYFSVKQLIWLWPLGILTSLLYVYVFYDSRLFADMSLQVYYFFISLYGWYFWVSGGSKSETKEKKLKVSRLNFRMLSVLLFVTFILTIISGYILINFTGSTLPWWDAFTTSASIVAMWMLARKILENWLFWVVIDLISMGIYIYKGLFPTVILFFVYSTVAIVGYFEWRKDLKI